MDAFLTRPAIRVGDFAGSQMKATGLSDPDELGYRLAATRPVLAMKVSFVARPW